MAVQSVERALDMLNHLAHEGLHGRTCTPSQLGRRLGLKLTTAHNLLKTLAQCGYADNRGNGQYTVGLRFGDVLRATVLSGPARDRVVERVRVLAQESGEAMVLTTLLHGRRVVIARAEPDRPVRVSVGALKSEDLLDLVTGQVLFAYASPEERQEIILRNSIATTPRIEKMSETIRREGVATRLMKDSEVFSLAIPALSSDGRLLGALGCYLPHFRYLAKHHRNMRKYMTPAACDLAGWLTSR